MGCCVQMPLIGPGSNVWAEVGRPFPPRSLSSIAILSLGHPHLDLCFAVVLHRCTLRKVKYRNCTRVHTPLSTRLVFLFVGRCFHPAGDRRPERDAQVRPAIGEAGDGYAAHRPVRSWGDALRTRAPPGRCASFSVVKFRSMSGRCARSGRGPLVSDVASPFRVRCCCSLAVVVA